MPQYRVIKKILNIRSTPAALAGNYVSDLPFGEVITLAGDTVAGTDPNNTGNNLWYRYNNNYIWHGGVEPLNIAAAVKQSITDTAAFRNAASFPPSLVNWNERVIKLPASISGTRGQGIKVAVLDRGIDDTHPDLAGNILSAADFTGSTWRDIIGHGTAMASFIAANNFLPDKGLCGVAPQSKIIVAKVLYDAGGPDDFLSTSKGLQYAMQQGADVINMSIGRKTVVPRVDDIINSISDSVLVASVRQYYNNPLIQFPASNSNVIPVLAATKDWLNDNWNNLPAPLVIMPYTDRWCCSIKSNNYYTQDTGSSDATAVMSGIVALILAANPQQKRDKMSMLNTLAMYSSSISEAFDDTNNLHYIIKL